MSASFSRAIHAELRKFFTTRLWWGMGIGVFLSGAAFALLFGILLTSEAAGTGGATGIPSGDAVQVANSVYTAGLSVGYLLMLTIGVIQIGSEYRHSTISSTFLSVPRRATAMLAKVVALLLIGVGYGVVSLVGSVAVGALTLNLRGEDAFPSDQVLRTIALSLLVLGLWAPGRARRQGMGLRPRARGAVLPHRGDQRHRQRRAETRRTYASSGGPRRSRSPHGQRCCPVWGSC